MIPATKAQEMQSQSFAAFNAEVNKIEQQIFSACDQNKDCVVVPVRAEHADRLTETLKQHGYTVERIHDTSLEISWKIKSDEPEES